MKPGMAHRPSPAVRDPAGKPDPLGGLIAGDSKDPLRPQSSPAPAGEDWGEGSRRRDASRFDGLPLALVPLLALLALPLIGSPSTGTSWT